MSSPIELWKEDTVYSSNTSNNLYLGGMLTSGCAPTTSTLSYSNIFPTVNYCSACASIINMSDDEPFYVSRQWWCSTDCQYQHFFNMLSWLEEIL